MHAPQIVRLLDHRRCSERIHPPVRLSGDIPCHKAEETWSYGQNPLLHCSHSLKLGSGVVPTVQYPTPSIRTTIWRRIAAVPAVARMPSSPSLPCIDAVSWRGRFLPVGGRRRGALKQEDCPAERLAKGVPRRWRASRMTLVQCGCRLGIASRASTGVTGCLGSKHLSFRRYFRPHMTGVSTAQSHEA